MSKKDWVLIAGIMVSLLASRLIPHAPNFTATISGIIFGAIAIRHPLSVFYIMLSYFIADLIINVLIYQIGPVSLNQLIWVYAPLIFIYFISRSFKNITNGPSKVLILCLTGSVLFFVVSNFGVWMLSSLYSKDLTGLSACYIAALPFWTNEIAGTLFYSLVMFGVYWMYFPIHDLNSNGVKTIQ